MLGFKGICNRLCTSHLSVFGNEIPLVWTVFEVELPVNKRDITIPSGLNAKWQSIVDTTTEVINVPVALIMRLVPPHLKVVVSSRSSHSPRPLRSAEQVAGYYGGTVVTTRCKLLVPNALRDESWQGNLASKSGFISYLGIPLLWPDGQVFGTFCALDTIENSYDGHCEKLMSQFKELIEAQLGLLYQDRRMELIGQSLNDVKEDFHPVPETEGEVIITADHRGNIIFFNRAAESLFGYSAGEATGKPFTLILPERLRKAFAIDMEGLLSSWDLKNNRKVIQTTGLRKDGIEFPIEINGACWEARGESFFTAKVRVTAEQKQLGELLQQRNRELATINAIAQSISQSLRLDEILENGLDTVLETMGLPAGGIFLLKEMPGERRLVIQKGLTDDLIQAARKLPPGVTSLNMANRHGERIAPGNMFPGKATRVCPPEMQYILKLSLLSRSKDLGSIVLVTQNQSGFTTENVQLLETISHQIGVAVDNAWLFEKANQLSITDELTGLYNHRHFSSVLQSEIQRAQRYGGALSLIMLDLDGFKEYNDHFGHVSGDAALKAFGQTLGSSLRQTDIPFRYGGDEFAIILPSTKAERARNVIDHIQSKWQRTLEEQHQVQQIPLGFSAGIAQFPKNAETAEVLTLLADSALYDSKRQGGYRCTLVSELKTASSDVSSPATLDHAHALLTTADARNPHAREHARRVAIIAELIGKKLKPAELAELKVAALLHDIGKIDISESILNKPDELTESEWSLVRKHPEEGARIASYILGTTGAIPIIRHHHEWYDGTGYPEKLKGNEIPLGARIIAVADAFSTMTTPRPDRNAAISHEEALDELKKYSGIQFDPELVQSLIKVIKEVEELI